MTHNDLRYEFGPYQRNPGKRILLVLVKCAGQLVEKDELLKEVWPDTFVEEANLSQNIFTLGDDRGGISGVGLNQDEKNQISDKLKRLLGTTQQPRESHETYEQQ